MTAIRSFDVDLIEVKSLIERAWKEVDERIEEIRDLERTLCMCVDDDE